MIYDLHYFNAGHRWFRSEKGLSHAEMKKLTDNAKRNGLVVHVPWANQPTETKTLLHISHP